jgi:CubicO group peptidase (beta-lactamase class C family)
MPTKRRLHPGVAVLLLLPALASADLKLSKAIDRVFADFRADEPGCAVGVIHEGKFAYKVGYGLANMEYGIPITSKTVFRTGSVSKQFTAMAIAILAERGRIDLDVDVHTYLPDLIDYGHKVTVRQMLHHYAGMGDYDHEVFRKADGTMFRFGNEDFLTNDEFYRLVAKAGLVHEPGTVWQYSNLGYYLLGQVVERVSGESLREFAQRQIFGPLGMNATRFNDNVNQLVVNRADGYRKLDDGSWEIDMTNLSWVGDGGIYTDLDDFIQWDRNFYDNKLGEGRQSLVERMETPLPGMMEQTDEGPRPVNYAWGLQVDERFGERSIRHGGSWVGFTAYYERFPDIETSVVILCNSLQHSAYEVGERVSELAVATYKHK